MNFNIKVREIQLKDLKPIKQYWFTRTEEEFLAMGADISKFPSPSQFEKMLRKQIASPLNKKTSYALIWEYKDKQIGHCNVNQLKYGNQAHMHLHMWNPSNRRKGMGTDLVKTSIPFFFENLKLKTLWCEPYAQNLAPNKTISKLGFQFVKRYETIPGPINLHQEVCQYKMTRNRYKENYLK